MSACISRHGEYSEHSLDADFTCTLCGVLDEEAMRDELRRLRASQAPGPMSADRDDLARAIYEAGWAARRGMVTWDAAPEHIKSLFRDRADAALAWFAARAAAEGPDVEAVKAQGLREYADYLEAVAHDLADMMDEDDVAESERQIAATRARAEQVAALPPAAPEVVETAEALDALPVGSVIRTAGESVFEQTYEDCWERVGYSMEWSTAELVADFMPARVLYRPDATDGREGA